MSWACELTALAEKDLRGLPRDVQGRIAQALNEMTHDPFRGDVKPLKGAEWKGFYRRRIGSYRILYFVNWERKVLTIDRILLRSGRTYK